MPYDPVTGVFTLVAGNPVVTGTVVSSTWANTTLEDIAAALGSSLSTGLPRDGSKPMTGPLQAMYGSNLIPGLNFGAQGSANSGLYYLQHSPPAVVVAQAGVPVMYFSNGAVITKAPIYEPVTEITANGGSQQLTSAASIVVISSQTQNGTFVLPVSFPVGTAGYAYRMQIIKKDWNGGIGDPGNVTVQAAAPATLNGVVGGSTLIHSSATCRIDLLYHNGRWFGTRLDFALP